MIPKIQGSLKQCVDQLERYATRNNITIIAHFGVATRIVIGTSGPSHDAYFMWRYEYNEFDNSA